MFWQYLHELTAQQKKTVRRLLPVLSLPQRHCDCRGFLRRKSQDIKIETHFFYILNTNRNDAVPSKKELFGKQAVLFGPLFAASETDALFGRRQKQGALIT